MLGYANALEIVVRLFHLRTMTEETVLCLFSTDENFIFLVFNLFGL